VVVETRTHRVLEENLITRDYSRGCESKMANSKTSKSTFLNPTTGRISITDAFGVSLAELLANKIVLVHRNFKKKEFCKCVEKGVVGKAYTQRNEVIADNLKKFLPEEFKAAVSILMKIIGPENSEETGMFTNFYWLMPVGKFVEKYGIDHFRVSMTAIEEITKRNTGEYAIRPFARAYPNETLKLCRKWAKSKNFHLRRLASEGLRPKLPWAPKLDTWNADPKPIFQILELLKEDEIKFVKKSVANHLRDWLKVNPTEAKKLIGRWTKSRNANTQWILKHAHR
jgi:3-methyladenine DNA glycosylase AlkC